MALTLNGSTNTIAGLAVGGLPDGIVDAGTLASNSVETAKINAKAVTAAKRGEGAILQVVTATNTTNVEVTGSTYTTFITADITPTAQNSKYIVIITTGIYTYENASWSDFGCGWTMSRSIGGSSLYGLLGDPQDSQGPYGHWKNAGADGQLAVISTKIGYDSPNTTSTLTYYGEGRPYRPTGNVARFGETTDSQIVIYEVAGS